MTATPGLTVIVTAMNEMGNLVPTIEMIMTVVPPRFANYEILVIDDGSTDGTSQLADRLAAGNPRIRVHHNGDNRGLGYSLNQAFALARLQHSTLVSGNNLVPLKGLEAILDRVDSADVIISYIIKDGRSSGRRLLSRTVVNVMNLLFGLHLRYYTGPWVCRTESIRRLRLISPGSIALAEIPIRLLDAGLSFAEVGLYPNPRTSGETKTFRLKNITAGAGSILRLLWDVRIARGGRRQGRPDPADLQ